MMREEWYMFSWHSLRDSQKKLCNYGSFWRKGKQNQSIDDWPLRLLFVAGCSNEPAPSQQLKWFTVKSPSIWLLKTSEADWSCFPVGPKIAIHSSIGPAGMYGTKLEKHDIWLTRPDLPGIFVSSKSIFIYTSHQSLGHFYRMIGPYHMFLLGKRLSVFFSKSIINMLVCWLNVRSCPVRYILAHRYMHGSFSGVGALPAQVWAVWVGRWVVFAVY